MQHQSMKRKKNLYRTYVVYKKALDSIPDILIKILRFYKVDKKSNNFLTNNDQTMVTSMNPVSYTHLDVYKRQR